MLIVAALVLWLVFCALAVGLGRAAARGEEVDAARRGASAVDRARFTKGEAALRAGRER